jgi:enoyl-CoA hydratase/carnithine racemase
LFILTLCSDLRQKTTDSMSKAKYYLMTGEMVPATKAEQMGLITEVVPKGTELQRAQEIAAVLAKGPQRAIQYTKRSLNQWHRQAILTSFDYSCALEMLNFAEPDAKEGLAALRAKRAANFPSAKL